MTTLPREPQEPSSRKFRAERLKTAAVFLVVGTVTGAIWIWWLGGKAAVKAAAGNKDSLTCGYDKVLGEGPGCSPPFDSSSYNAAIWLVLIAGVAGAVILYYVAWRIVHHDVHYIAPVPGASGTYYMSKNPPQSTGSPATGDSAGWQPDPYGRHELRYFDGSNWRAEVTDDGVVSADPMNVPPPPGSSPSGPPSAAKSQRRSVLRWLGW